MAPIITTNRNQQFRNGVLISEQVVQVDVTEEVNEAAIMAKARQALTANATFLAISNPTAAQNAAQAKALTRQLNGLLRLLLHDLADVSDT